MIFKCQSAVTVPVQYIYIALSDDIVSDAKRTSTVIPNTTQFIKVCWFLIFPGVSMCFYAMVFLNITALKRKHVKNTGK